MIFRGLSTRPGHTRAQLPHPWRAVGSTVGSAVGRRAGNPVGHGGERGGESAARRKVGSAVESARGGWGFCTIRSIAAACRRRVASLLTQFPPRDREESGKPRGARWGGERGTPWGTVGRRAGNPVGHGGEESGEPRGARWGARRGGLWSGPWGPPGADGGFAPLEASLRRVAGVSRPY